MLPACAYSKRRSSENQYLAEKPAVKETHITAAGSKLEPGEYYYYRVNWLGINVGHALIEVKEIADYEGKKCLHVTMSTATNAFFSMIYKVIGEVESYVDEENLRPLYYRSEMTRKKKYVFKEMRYDYAKKTVYAKDKKGEYEIDIPEGMIDPLGFFYYFRLHPVDLEKPMHMTINGGKKNYPITVYVKEERYMHTPAGCFWTFLVRPEKESERQFDDALNAPGSLSVWYSSDEKRVPVMIALKVPIGTALAVLVKTGAPDAD